MERKLIKQGGGGFTIYLPKKWVDKKGLKEGNIINVEESENALIIGGESSKDKEITLHLDDEKRENIKNILTNIYRNGYNKIIIKNIDSENQKEVRKITSELLLGFELTENSKNSCTLENISEPSGDKYEVILRKVFFTIKDSISLLISQFDEPENTFKELEEMRKTNDKMILFCRRTITKESYNKNIVFNWEMLSSLGHIEKSIYYMYKYAKENKIKSDNDIIEILNKSKEHFDMLERSFYENNSEYLDKLHKSSVKYPYNLCLDLISNAKGKKAVVHSYLREALRLIKVTGSPIRSIILNKK